jgi:hypothetical protein
MKSFYNIVANIHSRLRELFFVTINIKGKSSRGKAAPAAD